MQMNAGALFILLPRITELTEDEVKKLDGVSDADYGQEWLKKFSAFINMIKLIGILKEKNPNALQ